MKNYFFTFGQSHISKDGDQMKDFWVRVSANSESDARECFCSHFAEPVMGARDKFAFSYAQEEFKPSYFPGGEYATLTAGPDVNFLS